MNYKNGFKHRAPMESTCPLVLGDYKTGVKIWQSLLAPLICIFYKMRRLNNEGPEPLRKSISFLFFFSSV